MKNSQTVFLGLVVNLLVTGLCTLALAWIDIAKKSKKLKVAKGGERRAVVFHRGQVRSDESDEHVITLFTMHSHFVNPFRTRVPYFVHIYVCVSHMRVPRRCFCE